MRVLVAGATGVVGRRLLPLLTASGHEVTALVRAPARGAAIAQPGVTPIAADLFERAQLAAPMRGQEAVINLATHIPSSAFAMMRPGAWRENDRIRREASANLVDAALQAGVKRFVQESFAPTYPDRGAQWIDEGVALAPSAYNRSLLDAERQAARFAGRGGVAVVLRFAAFYGLDAVQTRVMVRLARLGFAALPGARDAYLSSIAHDDAASAAAAALTLPGGVYNVADDEPLTRRQFFDALAAALRVKPPSLPPRLMTLLLGSVGETMARSARISNRKLRGSSDWAPRYKSARDGFAAIAMVLNAGV
ncbi:MAG TPA: NAD(P)H-binding protein [Stellaceae bacterium]|nr:NAD(P)H-binding protein [Stellaceae bacterium]